MRSWAIQLEKKLLNMLQVMVIYLCWCMRTSNATLLGHALSAPKMAVRIAAPLAHILHVSSRVVNGTTIPAEAARHGHFDCMKYSLDHRCEWISEEFGLYEAYLAYCAVEGGNLDCLIYAHNLGCTWDENTCVIAAEHGNLSCLRYLHEHGCPWDEYVYENAVLHQHADCVEYLLAQDCPGYYPVCMIHSNSGDNLWLLKIAHKLYLPWNKHTMRHARLMKYKESIQFLKERDCPTT